MATYVTDVILDGSSVVAAATGIATLSTSSLATKASLTAETSSRKSADSSLQTNIDNEVSRATTKENTLNTQIYNNSISISNENVRAVNAEAILQANIDSTNADLAAEILRSTSEEAILQGEINDEIARAMATELALNNLIDSESARAISAETILENEIIVLHSLLDSESVRAITVETELHNMIDSESVRAILAEDTLHILLDSEANRAKAVEEDLQIQIDSEGVRIVKLEKNKLDNSAENSAVKSEITYTADSFSITNTDNATLMGHTPIALEFDSEGGTRVIELDTLNRSTDEEVDLAMNTTEFGLGFRDATGESKIIVDKNRFYRLNNSEEDDFITRSVLDPELAKKQDNISLGNNMEWDSEGKVANRIKFDYDPVTRVLNIYNW